jgi:hypothetical protein
LGTQGFGALAAVSEHWTRTTLTQVAHSNARSLQLQCSLSKDASDGNLDVYLDGVTLVPEPRRELAAALALLALAGLGRWLHPGRAVSRPAPAA